tara:strand:+ start:839 stop:1327 length:489 start_codon:yes stop_codon:yes gene_type:complete
MNQKEKLTLQKMISENSVEETTELIRQVKHSEKIRQDIKMLNFLKKKHKKLLNEKNENFDDIAVKECIFLFNNYTDIYNKVKKDEIDLNILNKFLDVLEKIENGKINQHEGSYEVGKLLKSMYIDSALRKSKKLDKQNDKQNDSNNNKTEVKNISWRQFKNM